MGRSIAVYQSMKNGKIASKVYEGDVSDYDLYHYLGGGSMVFVELPSGLDYAEALEKAQELKEEASELLATEANGSLISTGYEEFVEAFRLKAARLPSR